MGATLRAGFVKGPSAGLRRHGRIYKYVAIEAALAAARAELGTASMKDTVNEALRRAASPRRHRVEEALDRLAWRPRYERGEAWR